jgi:hypothetical protein
MCKYPRLKFSALHTDKLPLSCKRILWRQLCLHLHSSRKICILEYSNRQRGTRSLSPFVPSCGSKININTPTSPLVVNRMRKLPWRKLQIYVEQPIWFNNISTGHSCSQALSAREIYYSLLQCLRLKCHENFPLGAEGMRGGGQLRGPLLLFQYSMICIIVYV